MLQTGPVSKLSEKVQDKLTLWRGSVKNLPAAALVGLLSILLLAECQIHKQIYTFAFTFQHRGAKLCVSVTWKHCAYRNYILGHERRCSYDRNWSISAFTTLWLLEWTKPQSRVFPILDCSLTSVIYCQFFYSCIVTLWSINDFSMFLREKFVVYMCTKVNPSPF